MEPRRESLNWKLYAFLLLGMPLPFVIPLVSDRMMSVLGTALYSLYILSIPIALMLFLMSPLPVIFLLAKSIGINLHETYEIYELSIVEKIFLGLGYIVFLIGFWTLIQFLLDLMGIDIPSGKEIEDWIRVNTI